MIDPRIIRFLKKHHVLTIATCVGNEPWCASCFYVYMEEEESLVFTTDIKTRHGREFIKNEKVAGTVALETNIIGKIRGIQFQGVDELAVGEDGSLRVLERVEAGLALVGTEVKSIREGGLNFSDAYVDFRGGELFLVGCRIAPYSHGNLMNHAPDRDRKLLLNRREIKKLHNKIRETGLTIVPLLLFISPEGYAKIEIALAKGKKMYDKRETLKEKDNRREMERKDTYRE